MKEKMMSTIAYGVILLMIGSIAFIFGLLSSEIEEKIVYKEKIIKSEPLLCSPIPEKVVEKIVYRDRIIYKEKTVYRDRVVRRRTSSSEKTKFGLSLVGASFGSNIGEYSYGLGFKIRLGKKFSHIELLKNKSIIFSLGHEF